MSNLELFADDIDGYLCVAIVDNGYLIDLYVSKPRINDSWASIYLGRVLKLDTKLDAAIIDLGNGQKGLLPAAYATPRTAIDDEVRKSGISSMLMTGQEILVHIKVEGKANSPYENHKLPRLTTNLHVPGGFLVYSPYSDHIECSGNIDEKIIDKLETKVKIGGGWKVYPSANKLSSNEIEFEVEYLKKRWKEIVAKAKESQGVSGILEVGPISLFRALMDYGTISFANIHVGNKLILNIMEDWSKKHMPALATSKRLRLFRPMKAGERLFDIYDLYSEIEKVKEPLIELDNGGNIIIENTSALTTVDINQGSSGDINETNFKATYEIARQIKLRNLSGIILIDFIGNVPDRKERERLLNALEHYLEGDVGEAQVHGFTRLGIVEITRRRRTAAVSEYLE